MKYILLIYGAEQAWSSMSKEQMEEVYAGHRAYGEAMTKAGVMQGGSELKPIADRDEREIRQRQAPNLRRPVRRDQGAARRLLRHRRAEPGRRAGLGREDAGDGGRHRRGASAGLDGLTTVDAAWTHRRGRRAEGWPAGARRPHPPHGRFRRRRGRAAGGVRPGARRLASPGRSRQPGAWLNTVARRIAIDRQRRRRETELPEDLESVPVEIEEPHDIEDDRLRLLFTCCHPALAPDAQSALALRTLGGLTTREIARGFVEPEATTAQRLVRAKRKIREAGIPYEVPPREKLPERIDTVLGVLYLIFNEGYSSTDDDSLLRPDLMAEAIRLARLTMELLPDNAEAMGLLGVDAADRRAARRAAHPGRRSRPARGAGPIALEPGADRRGRAAAG